jgi:hypothetical protein
MDYDGIFKELEYKINYIKYDKENNDKLKLFLEDISKKKDIISGGSIEVRLEFFDKGYTYSDCVFDIKNNLRDIDLIKKILPVVIEHSVNKCKKKVNKFECDINKILELIKHLKNEG